MSGLLQKFGGSLLNGAENTLGKFSFSSTISNMVPTVFSGLSFAGKGLLSLTTSSISLIVSVGGGLFLLLVSQKPNPNPIK